MKNGFTLLELLLYIGIIALVVVIVGETFVLFVTSQKKIEIRRLVEQNLDLCLKKIEQSVKEASNITGSYPANTLSLTNVTTTYSLENGVFKKDGVAISSDKVVVATTSDFLFYKVEATSTKHTIQVKMKVRYNSDDPQLKNIEVQSQTTFSIR